VTASESSRPKGRPLVEEALDLLVYAPVGLISSSLEELRPDRIPTLAEHGRGRIRRLLTNARVVGNFTIATGRRVFEAELGRWRPPGSERTTDTELAPQSASAEPEPASPWRPPPTLAIPDYETLSASQVVRRLDGLGPDELEAVYHYEATTRHRGTILHRIQQLQGTEETPGPTRRPG